MVLVASFPLRIFATDVADSESVPAIPDADPYVAVPTAARKGDPARVYRVMFEARHGAEQPDKLVPAVAMAGTEINTLAAHHVPRRNVKFAVVFHTGPSDDALLDDAHYRAKYGVANPNLKVLSEMKASGVELYVCGQELLADNVPLDAITPDVTIAEDGVVMVMELENDGYAHLVF